MLDYKNLDYIKNSEPVKPEFNQILGAPVNEKYSALIYAELEELEKFHRGGFYSGKGIYSVKIRDEEGGSHVYAHKEIYPSNSLGQEILIKINPFGLGEKSKRDIHQQALVKAQETLKKFTLLKEFKIPTFDEIFIYKGTTIIATLLQDEDKIILANNDTGRDVPIKTGYGQRVKRRNYIRKLKINNFEGLIDSIFIKLERATSQGMFFGIDTLWFQVPRVVNPEGVGAKWFVGDVDMIEYVEMPTTRIRYRFIEDIEYFIKKFVHPDKKEECLQIFYRHLEKFRQEIRKYIPG
jgi:hypothetical protein